jgi:hypothetical protein
MSKIIFMAIVISCILYIGTKAFDKTIDAFRSYNEKQIEILNSVK